MGFALQGCGKPGRRTTHVHVFHKNACVVALLIIATIPL